MLSAGDELGDGPLAVVGDDQRVGRGQVGADPLDEVGLSLSPATGSGPLESVRTTCWACAITRVLVVVGLRGIDDQPVRVDGPAPRRLRAALFAASVVADDAGQQGRAIRARRPRRRRWPRRRARASGNRPPPSGRALRARCAATSPQTYSSSITSPRTRTVEPRSSAIGFIAAPTDPRIGRTAALQPGRDEIGTASRSSIGGAGPQQHRCGIPRVRPASTSDTLSPIMNERPRSSRRSSAASRSIPGLGFLQSHPASGGWGQYFAPSRTTPSSRDKADEPFVNRSSLVRGDQPAPDPGLVADHDQAQVRGGKSRRAAAAPSTKPDPVRIAWIADVLDQRSVAIQEDRRLGARSRIATADRLEDPRRRATRPAAAGTPPARRRPRRSRARASACRPEGHNRRPCNGCPGRSCPSTASGVSSSKIMTWSTDLSSATIAARSASGISGRPSPFSRRTASSELTPTNEDVAESPGRLQARQMPGSEAGRSIRSSRRRPGRPPATPLRSVEQLVGAVRTDPGCGRSRARRPNRATAVPAPGTTRARSRGAPAARWPCHFACTEDRDIDGSG